MIGYVYTMASFSTYRQVRRPSQAHASPKPGSRPKRGPVVAVDSHPAAPLCASGLVACKRRTRTLKDATCQSAGCDALSAALSIRSVVNRPQKKLVCLLPRSLQETLWLRYTTPRLTYHTAVVRVSSRYKGFLSGEKPKVSTPAGLLNHL